MKMKKTRHTFDWEKGYETHKYFSRSFDTIEAAEKFAEGKLVVDIYRSKGRIVVEWCKVIDEK